ncbi:uncharacterized protein LOC110022013 [Phalaenopsis equestris]|uniref:uncharacterized protein LOC110022013 n=1 Tax=Phalaenopsis equestris TaxID=78828 RepID=UPI0009E5DA57|nr:uncharacterized protein LOC110022013 [Phalaenopsis equestris]
MATSPSIKVWEALFAALACFMLAILLYTTITDGSPFRLELLTPWLSATLVDFFVNVVAIAAWVVCKESSWLSTCFWVILLVCFGSISTCAYILKLLFNISGQDSSQYPLHLLLLRKDGERNFSFWSVVLGRVVFSALGIIMSTIVVYTLVTDGSPFRKELLTPWMAATLIDFYINVFAISVLVFHKESTWIGAIFWICLLIVLGSIATCAYIVIQLFKRSCPGTAYHVLQDTHLKQDKDSTQ